MWHVAKMAIVVAVVCFPSYRRSTLKTASGNAVTDRLWNLLWSLSALLILVIVKVAAFAENYRLVVAGNPDYRTWLPENSFQYESFAWCDGCSSSGVCRLLQSTVRGIPKTACCTASWQGIWKRFSPHSRRGIAPSPRSLKKSFDLFSGADSWNSALFVFSANPAARIVFYPLPVRIAATALRVADDGWPILPRIWSTV